MSRQECTVFHNLANAFTKPVAVAAATTDEEEVINESLKKWKNDLLITFANTSSKLEDVWSKIESCPLLKQEERIILREANIICWSPFWVKENLSNILITFEESGQTFNERFIDWSVVEDGWLYHFWFFIFYYFYPALWPKKNLAYRVNVLEWFYTSLVFTDEMWRQVKLNAWADPWHNPSPQSLSIAYQKRGLIINSNLPNNRLGLSDFCDGDDFATIHWNNHVLISFYLYHFKTNWCWMDCNGEKHSHCTDVDNVDVKPKTTYPKWSRRINGNLGKQQQRLH